MSTKIPKQQNLSQNSIFLFEYKNLSLNFQVTYACGAFQPLKILKTRDHQAIAPNFTTRINILN
jgi:hypothetical protein